MLRNLHRNLVHFRRVQVLVGHLAKVIPRNLSVLDVGSGDGRLAFLLSEQRPDLKIAAIDTTVRKNTLVPTTHYDGGRFPFESKSFDLLMMIDVLHHIEDIDSVMAEVVRVSRQYVVIKDHFVKGMLARSTLKLMDNVSNRQFGIAIPANYQTESQWEEIFLRSHLRSIERRDHLGLYPIPLSWLFERNLHFLNLLVVDPSIS